MRTALPVMAAAAILVAAQFYTVSGATRYVWLNSPEPKPPYTNWATAAMKLQDAVDAAAAADEIVVTNGTYATGGRAVYGTMTNRVAVTKPLRLRSINGPQFTIIEGAKASGGGNWEGAIRCVYLASGASLSGFTLTNGTTMDWGDDRDRDASGGGVWCASTNVTLTNCVLSGNSAVWLGGGAFRGTLHDCELTGNSAYYGGGANESRLYHCTLTDNSAFWGGGGVSSGTLDNCTLTRNSSRIFGGGACYSTLRACTLTGNLADNGGGGTYVGTLYNCTLAGNSAGNRWLISGHGGGALESTLYNCTVTGNSAAEGGGVYSSPSEACMLYNCIVYFNRARNGANYSGTSSNFYYSCTTPLPTGSGNIDADPQLADLAHISSSSPCIGAGSPAHATRTDIDGEPWADPPAMGADQPRPTVGPLNVSIEAGLTNVIPTYEVWFMARINGPLLQTVWDFGDGTVLTNQPVASHSWSTAGAYAVQLTGTTSLTRRE